MAKSIVEICNSALYKIGARKISSLDDGSTEANACKERYEPCKRAVLRMHPWNSAIKRATLSPLTEVPAFGFSSKFQLPGDFIRVVNVSELTQPDYKIEGRELLADESSIELKYVYDVQDPTKLDDLLSEAIAAYLAWDICFKITQSLQTKESLKVDKNKALSAARLVDSQEEPSPELQADYFLEARVGPVGPILTPRRNW